MARCSRDECFGEVRDGVCLACGTPANAPSAPVAPEAAIAEPTPTSMVRPTSMMRPQHGRRAQPPLSPDSTAFTPQSRAPGPPNPRPQGPGAPGPGPQQQPQRPVGPPRQASPSAPPAMGEQPPTAIAPQREATTFIRPPTGRHHAPEPSDHTGSSSTGTGTGGSDSRSTGTSDSRSGSGRTTGRSRRSRTSSRTSTRMRIGQGLVEVSRTPYRDPSTAIMANPMVAEKKRYCGNCGKPVGRGDGKTPGNPKGTCANCGTQFSFLPKLESGEVVGGQYEVLGCLAYGGLGWIYLAKDRNVSERWVALKGLIDTGDPSALAAAVAEQQFLAEVEHSNIVKIYNFVQHPDPDTGTQIGYIVMEYVGGQSLRELALSTKDAGGKLTPLPLAQVIAYGMEILPALGYLHSVGLLYCDLKPDNVLQTHDQLKLIDLGAVRRIDDMTSPIFFTTGYAAPELATEGPSVQSDIYTVGRMLAVLSFDFLGYTKKYQYSLPTPREVPLFALFESYYRLLKRACDPDPNRRFSSAEEMADQLVGVLREVLALSTGTQYPGRSGEFGPELRTFGSEQMTSAATAAKPPPPEWSDVLDALPVPQADTNDSAAGLISSAGGGDPEQILDTLADAPQESVEAHLWRARARIDLGDLYAAGHELGVAETKNVDEEGHVLPPDWRISWTRGLLALASRRPREARPLFDEVYDLVPGEVAPKLALAVSAEYCGDFFAAARLYELVWRTDRNYVSAAFGLARVYLAQGDRSGALDVLESVPDRSSHYVVAQLAAITSRTRAATPDQLTEKDLLTAGRRLQKLRLDAERRHRVSADVLTAAQGWIAVGKPRAGNDPNVKLLDCALNDRDVRFGLESHYRSLARLASGARERFALIDLANSVRPQTRW